MIRKYFIPLLFLSSLILASIFAITLVNTESVKNMRQIYSFQKSYLKHDGNKLTIVVKWFHAPHYIGNELVDHLYAGFTRIIADANDGNDYERWYVNEHKAILDLLTTKSTVNLHPNNPLGCLKSISGGVSATVSVSPEGPMVQVGVWYSYTVAPYSISVKPMDILPARWVFEPCSNVYGAAWTVEATVMYASESPPPVVVKHYLGATYLKEEKRCIGPFCWWELVGGNGHYHLWSDVTKS